MFDRQEYSKLYYINNKERMRENSRKAAKKQRTLYPERGREYSRKYIRNNPEQHLLTMAKSRARKRGLEFDLTLEDIVIPEYCPYLGIKLEVLGEKFSSPSLDRIDNSKGYIKSNIEVISFLANGMKSFANKEQLISFSKFILKRYSNG